MLGNVAPLWETMLAAMKLGAVIVPATTLLTRNDLADRFARGRVSHVIAGADAAAQIRRFARRLHAHRGRRRRRRAGQRYEECYAAPAALHAGRRDARRRSDAALFHLRHDGDAEARPAQPSELSGRTSVDDVLDRFAARRRASEYLVAGLGQARLELFLFAVDRRGNDLHRQPAPVQRARPARHHRALPASPRFARRRRCGAC